MTGAWATIDTPLGELALEGDERGVTALHLPDLRPALDPARRDPEALAAAVGQVEEYFAGSRRSFDLPLAPAGGGFFLRVWRETSASGCCSTWRPGASRSQSGERLTTTSAPGTAPIRAAASPPLAATATIPWLSR